MSIGTYEDDAADWKRAHENYKEAESALAAATAWLNDAEYRMSRHWGRRLQEADERIAAARRKT